LKEKQRRKGIIRAVMKEGGQYSRFKTEERITGHKMDSRRLKKRREMKRYGEKSRVE
jgi:hypothetical protein